MKNIYTKLFLPFLFLQLYLPGSVQAQCSCGAGIPATPIVQTLTLPPTTASTLTFNFQQFDPTVGTLNCVSFADSVSGLSITGAKNTAPVSTAYLFMLSLTSKIAGPGISILHPFSKQYGYDTLTAYGFVGDSITYGPANFVTNPTDIASTGGNAAYLGTGLVPFVYSVNGGMITQDGGSNYKASVSTTIGGTMKLTYYYCPLLLLASNMKNFSATRTNNNVMLKWDAQNAGQIDQFDVEYSTNGVDFYSVANIPSDHNEAGSYRYDYTLNNSAAGAVYFRIKQTNSAGKAGYSAMQKIQLNSKNGNGMAIYPNPAVTGLSVGFDHPLSGDYTIDLLNTSGQVVLNRKVKLANSSTIPLNWNSKPAPGVYFTRITNSSSMEQQIARVIIK